MQTILTTTINEQVLYLSHDLLATDRIENAKCYRDLTDATIAAVDQNTNAGWMQWGIRWTPEQVLYSEEQARINQWCENDRPYATSHR